MTKLRECRKELQFVSCLNSIFNSNWASSTVEKDRDYSGIQGRCETMTK